MSDYISREAAIAYIREQSEELQKAFEELGGESGIYTWIPCSERLPKVCKDTSYLSYIPSFGAVDIADYHPDVDEWTFMGLPITVTHWMPLPEPPEEVLH